MGRFGLLIAALAVVFSACSSAATTTTSTTGSTVLPDQTETTPALETTSELETTTTIDEGVSAGPIDLVATPAQQEGSYYPTEKLEDQDNDLTAVVGASGSPEGTILILDGRLLTTDGQPISGAVVEVWQTDANGIYLHPSDPKTKDRDPNFQFYGESLTGESGSWFFRTIDPGYYEPRPRHIHVKVRLDGQELLTTQIYFEGDERLAGESIDGGLIAEVASFQEGVTTVLTVTHDLVVDL